MPTKTHAALLSTDKALGLVGCGLAAASCSFGLYMAVHGPAAGPQPSGGFTVFAQLAPKPREAPRTHGPSTSDDLDPTATASIRKPADRATDEPAEAVDATTPILPGILLSRTADDSAEIAIDGRTRTVRIGDTIPGAGEVLAILPGRRPMLKTSMGLIVSR